MTLPTFIIYIFVFLYGIVIGSFLNVCIYRIPKKESIVTVGSHCMKCGHQLKWYDLFPLFSFLFLKGKCRYCGTKLSVQYPVIEFPEIVTVSLYPSKSLSWKHSMSNESVRQEYPMNVVVSLRKNKR